MKTRSKAHPVSGDSSSASTSSSSSSTMPSRLRSRVDAPPPVSTSRHLTRPDAEDVSNHKRPHVTAFPPEPSPSRHKRISSLSDVSASPIESPASVLSAVSFGSEPHTRGRRVSLRASKRAKRSDATSAPTPMTPSTAQPPAATSRRRQRSRKLRDSSSDAPLQPPPGPGSRQGRERRANRCGAMSEMSMDDVSASVASTFGDLISSSASAGAGSDTPPSSIGLASSNANAEAFSFFSAPPAGAPEDTVASLGGTSEEMKAMNSEDSDSGDEDDLSHAILIRGGALESLFPLVYPYAAWTCSACTFVNGCALTRCDACAVPRLARSMDSLPEDFVVWECFDAHEHAYVPYNIITCNLLEQAWRELKNPGSTATASSANAASDQSIQRNSLESLLSPSTFRELTAGMSMSTSSSSASHNGSSVTVEVRGRPYGRVVRLQLDGKHTELMPGRAATPQVRRLPSRSELRAEKEVAERLLTASIDALLRDVDLDTIAQHAPFMRLSSSVKTNNNKQADADPDSQPSSSQSQSQSTDDDLDVFTCSICFEEFSTSDKPVRLSRCEFDERSRSSLGHYFHRRCISSWLHRAKKCPACMREY